MAPTDEARDFHKKYNNIIKEDYLSFKEFRGHVDLLFIYLVSSSKCKEYLHSSKEHVVWTTC